MEASCKGQLLGEGRTAEVFAWAPGQVLKLYRDWWPLSNIEYEARMGSLVLEAGVSCPAVGDITQVNGRHGLVYERVDGPSMQHQLLSEPQRLEEMARL